MGRPLTCDLCLNRMFGEFNEPAYEVKLWRKTHSYDGYNPWVRKQRLDICADCMIGIIDAVESRSLTKRGTNTEPKSKLVPRPTKTRKDTK